MDFCPLVSMYTHQSEVCWGFPTGFDYYQCSSIHWVGWVVPCYIADLVVGYSYRGFFPTDGVQGKVQTTSHC